jgi:hypothetical protein
MIGLGRVLEEVLHDVEQICALDALIKLFQHFAFEGAPRFFAWLDTATGKSPVLVAFEAMKQDETIMHNDRRGAELNAMASNVYGDHRMRSNVEVSGRRRRSA